VSERGFTSKQRKKVIYGRAKHGKGKKIEKDNRKVKGEKNRKGSKIEAVHVLLLCLTSILQPAWLGWP